MQKFDEFLGEHVTRELKSAGVKVHFHAKPARLQEDAATKKKTLSLVHTPSLPTLSIGVIADTCVFIAGGWRGTHGARLCALGNRPRRQRAEACAGEERRGD